MVSDSVSTPPTVQHIVLKRFSLTHSRNCTAAAIREHIAFLTGSCLHLLALGGWLFCPYITVPSSRDSQTESGVPLSTAPLIFLEVQFLFVTIFMSINEGFQYLECSLHIGRCSAEAPSQRLRIPGCLICSMAYRTGLFRETHSIFLFVEGLLPPGCNAVNSLPW